MNCSHRWRIESPQGPTSEGWCSLCGATKVFINYDPRDDVVRKPGVGKAITVGRRTNTRGDYVR